MTTPKPVIDIPVRALLSVQTAAAIRSAFDRGVWAGVIPSERALCEIFHVSRPTVRRALAQLTKDGIISVRSRRRVRTKSVIKAPAAPEGRKILIVTHQRFSRGPAPVYQGISEMQSYLGRHGFECEVFVCNPRAIPAQLRHLSEFISRHRVLCSLLITVRREVQQWFAKLGMPTLVLGSCHPKVALPSFDVDHYSVSRHAAGMFLSKGHTRLALLVPTMPGPGDVATVAGFVEAAAKVFDGTVKAVVIPHDGTSQNINFRLDALFGTEDHPTALFVTNPKHVMFALTYLLRRGWLVPEKISLISRDQDFIFSELTPPISHYTFDLDRFTHRLARLILKLIDQKFLPAKPNLIFPRFVPGGTVRTLTTK